MCSMTGQGVGLQPRRKQILKKSKAIMNKMGITLLYAGFETCFGCDPQHQRYWDPIAQKKSHISNPDVEIFLSYDVCLTCLGRVDERLDARRPV